VSRLPVPMRCLKRPQVGGLVVPFPSYEDNDSALFANVDPRRRLDRAQADQLRAALRAPGL
jgi:hypothetical protein